MSDSESTSDSVSESENDSNVFLQWLMEKINSKFNTNEMVEKEYFKLVTNRLKFYSKAKAMMDDDPLFQKLEDIADQYINDHEDLNISKEAAMEYAIKQFKSIIMEKIMNFLYESDDDGEDIDEEMEENDDSDAENDDSDDDSDAENNSNNRFRY